MKKLTLIFIALIIMIAMTACGGNDGRDSTAGSGTSISVTVNIDFPEGTDVTDAAVDIPEGSSVLDALNAYVDGNDGEVIMDETSSSPYVLAINGVEADKSAGWVYEVNDEVVMESAQDCILKDGDKVSWKFESWD